jgi:hypothetical protein
VLEGLGDVDAQAARFVEQIGIANRFTARFWTWRSRIRAGSSDYAQD